MIIILGVITVAITLKKTIPAQKMILAQENQNSKNKDDEKEQTSVVCACQTQRIQKLFQPVSAI